MTLETTAAQSRAVGDSAAGDAWGDAALRLPLARVTASRVPPGSQIRW